MPFGLRIYRMIDFAAIGTKHRDFRVWFPFVARIVLIIGIKNHRIKVE